MLISRARFYLFLALLWLGPVQVSFAISLQCLKSVSSELLLPKVTGATVWGPTVVLEAPAVARPLSSMKLFTIGQYNVENLITHVGEYQRHPVTGAFVQDPNSGGFVLNSPPVDKPRADLLRVAAVIDQAQIDIGGFEEVDTLPSLSILRSLVHGRFRESLIEGNDVRGIDIGQFFAADLPFKIEIQSFKNVARQNGQEPLFSRDLPVVLLSYQDHPFMIIAMTHYKSQRPSDGDPTGDIRRAEQVQGTVKILKYYQQMYGDQVPLILLGDFNKDIRTGAEFKPLWDDLRLTDSFNLASPERSVPYASRDTQDFFPRDGQPVHSQLDSVSCSSVVKDMGMVYSASIMPYTNPDGSVMPIPQTFEDRARQPSDHRMVRVVLNLEEYIKKFLASLPH